MTDDTSQGTAPVKTPLRVGNCSGFYGDRLSAMREMLEGGRLDVLTGDYLAELTMLILGRDQLKDPSLGYARTFVRQLEDCLGLALERGVKIVANAGGLNPAGLADRVREVAAGLGLSPAVAHVEGDDLRSVGFEGALTANAYLGGFGIAAALREGADVVVIGRVTDASLVVGPAVQRFGWSPDRYDALAGAMVAGHLLECGTQATGGNFSGFLTLPRDDRPLGFPIAEICPDGSSVLTKHDGTGGAVTPDTTLAQLFYEIQGTRYLGPDATVRLDTVSVQPAGPDRVAITGVRGEPPPSRLKVGVNELGGFRNTAEFVLTGLDQDAKADWLRAQLEPRLTAASVTWTRTGTGRPGAATEEQASSLLRCTVQDPSPDPVGRAFTSAAVELALASYPGFTMTAPPAVGTPYGVYRDEYVDRSAVTHTVVHADGTRETIPSAPPATSAPVAGGPAATGGAEVAETPGVDDGEGADGDGWDWPPRSEERAKGAVSSAAPSSAGAPGATETAPLGTFVHARSGDKGGDANLGLWVRRDEPERYAERVAWLLATVTEPWVRELLPETRELSVDVHPLPNLGGVNVVLHGLLGRGVAASTRFDPQAKGLGEWARSRTVEIPEALL